MASKAPPSRTNSAGVSRKLFHHHLSRRPTNASTASTSSTTILNTKRDDADDIVAKDSDGNFRLRVLKLPPLEDEQAQEEELGNERDKLLAAVQATLKRKVASLDDDNWIFEAEQPSQDG
ncbi:uncharacterized protein KY384_003678 [Bacidia gigantensis]|uniref:uncharacterized protein n=1 Tax=Bacidia gigantensis TaxID=2732470 RepID=UPI001D050C54|nr:uncharacterized protein KY384_003678 [Bacidia gigantensis]KAG8532041.1 hypothetical protein KY384_003678 [Bacidia gigantensis]